MKPTLVSFTYQGQTLSHFFRKSQARTARCWRYSSSPELSRCRADPRHGVTHLQTYSCEKQDVNLGTFREKRQENVKENGTLKMPGIALHLWAGCSQGALFPSTGQISSDFFFFLNVCFLLEVFCWRCPRATMGQSAWKPYWDLCRSSQISPSAESFFAELCHTTMPV